MGKPDALTDQLRQYVERSGKSLYRISQETGIGQSGLSRFMRAERGLSLESIDTLAEYLGLELVKRRGKRAKD